MTKLLGNFWCSFYSARFLDHYEAAYDPGDGTCDRKFKRTILSTAIEKVKVLENLRAALLSGGFDQQDGLPTLFDEKKREYGVSTSGDCEHANSIRFDPTMKHVLAIFDDASPDELSLYKGAAKKAFNLNNP